MNQPNGPGYSYFLKKTAGAWTAVYQGQNFDTAKEAAAGFPAGFIGSVPTISIALFTY